MLRKILLSLGLLLLLWEGVAWLWQLPTYILPTPRAVVSTLIVARHAIAQHTLITLSETLIGYLSGAVSGLLTAFFLLMFQPLRLFLLPLMLISQAIPIFALAPLLVLWLGFGSASKICVVMLMTFFPIASACWDGLHKTPPRYLEMARYMRGKKIPILRYIYFPAALPFLMSGLRVSAVFAPMGAILSEWVGASQGLGYLMLGANARLETSLVFAAILVLVVMALGLYFLVDVAAKRWVTW